MTDIQRLCGNALLAGGLAFVALTSSAVQAGQLSTEFRILHSFAGGSDGKAPHSVIKDALGNVYGTTASGGDAPCACGTVFKIAAEGTKTTLYSFRGKKDGANPSAGLISDSAGNLYGTTEGFGTDHYGTVFRLNPSGTLTTLHTFKKIGDGRNPLAALVMDKAGNLYGTTIRGGNRNSGTAYKIAPDGKESVLHSFDGTTRGGDGAYPAGELILDDAGNLYGSTGYGGSNACGSDGCCATPGCGTVFKIAPDGTTTILYAFLPDHNGRLPVGSLAMDRQGNLYGMTQEGGIGGGNGGGTIFKLTPDGTKSILYSFQIATGAVPHAGLVIDRKGNLYGTAEGGTYGFGVAFELTSDGKYKVLHDFTGEADGDDPSTNNLTTGPHGILLGATRGGTFGCSGDNCGTVFEIKR